MNNQVTTIFSRIRARLEYQIAQLPVIIGNEAVNFSIEAFERQGWDGAAWAKRRSKKDANRNLLVKSGRLKRSIRIIRTTAYSVITGTDVPYAGVHNEGGTIHRAARSETFVRNRFKRGPKSKMFGGLGAFQKGTTSGQGLSFRAYDIKMPQRQFIGHSTTLNSRIRKVIINHMKQAA